MKPGAATSQPVLSAREHRSEIRLGQNARDLGAFVALNLDLPVFHRAAGATDMKQPIKPAKVMPKRNMVIPPSGTEFTKFN